MAKSISITALQKENRELDKKVKDLRNNITDPEYIATKKKLEELRRAWFSRVDILIAQMRKRMSENETKIKELKDVKTTVYSERITSWFARYQSGVHFSGGLKITWVSEDENWVIVSNGGGIAGQGTAQGTGGYYYSGSEHWLTDTKGTWIRGSRRLGTVQGRLTNEKKQELINKIPVSND